MENLQETAQAGEDKITFVKSSTATKSLAVFIATSAIKDKVDHVKIRGVGAGAVNQMVKAMIASKSRLSEKGIKAEFDAYYQDVKSRESEEDTISAIEFCIKFTKQ